MALAQPAVWALDGNVNGVPVGSLYGSAMQWTEDSGKVVSLDQWKGRTVIISMAYSTCRRTCSATFKKLEELQAALDLRKQEAEIVLVSYDPKNDTPETWAQYRRQRGLNRKNWHFLSGSERDTKQLSRLLGLADFWSYDGHVLHDFKISILNPVGVIIKQLAWQDLNIRDIL
jgi:protein SCO1/2